MRTRVPAIVATVALAAMATAGPAARAATVELLVESSGAAAPLFAGSVTTLPHAVDGGDGSGPHPCAGPPGASGATATGALDDAMRSAGISWRGNWDPGFRDFFIDRIGPYASAAPDRYWSLTVNGRFASGGCLARVEDGDSVRFTYAPLSSPPAAAEPGSGAGGEVERGEGQGQAGASDPSATRLRRLARRAAAYLRRSPGAVGAEWGRLALALRREDGLGTAAGALLGERIGGLRHGSVGADVNATALAVLALERRRPRAAARAAGWLAAVQGEDGGFGYRPGAAADVDSTGLATWALARQGRGAAVRRGGEFIRSAQGVDGGFPSLPGGTSNAQSTGLALVALRAAGLGPAVHSSAGGTPLGFLSSLARPSGAIAYDASANPTPAWSSAQALLGLTARAKLLGG